MIQKIMLVRDEVDELICQAKDIQSKLGALLKDAEAEALKKDKEIKEAVRENGRLSAQCVTDRPINRAAKRWASPEAVRKWSEGVCETDGDVFTKYFDTALDVKRNEREANLHLGKLTMLSILNQDASNELYSYLYTIQKPV